jgi:hypothetical protein
MTNQITAVASGSCCGPACCKSETSTNSEVLFGEFQIHVASESDRDAVLALLSASKLATLDESSQFGQPVRRGERFQRPTCRSGGTRGLWERCTIEIGRGYAIFPISRSRTPTGSGPATVGSGAWGLGDLSVNSRCRFLLASSWVFGNRPR